MATIKVDTYVMKGNRPTIDKDPQATLDYSLDWGDWLAEVTDTIANSEWFVEAPLAVVSDTFTDTVAVAWISGGTPLPEDTTTLRATNRITTTEGRIDERSIFLRIVDR